MDHSIPDVDIFLPDIKDDVEITEADAPLNDDEESDVVILSALYKFVCMSHLKHTIAYMIATLKYAYL